MAKRSQEQLLLDVLESCIKIKTYTTGLNYAAFASDDKTIDAVIRNLQIIGEAVNRMSDEEKEQHPQIDWFAIRGLRNRVVHDYMGISLPLIWEIISVDIPDLQSKIEKIV